MARPNVPEPEDTEYFDDLDGYEPAKPTDHKWAGQSVEFHLGNLKEHSCMTDLEQRGNYIHCNTGNHGMAIGPGKILRRRDNGEYWLDEMQVLTTKKDGTIAKPR